ncbi:MAG TPA: hypothetical protein DEQ68_08440 [Ruminococcaceae bacterium]|nr:hypothetical protein [Oscillospiraceae bacterium]
MAELFGCERAREIMEKILTTLQEYEKQTDAMINAELEVLQEGVIARNELITTLDELKDDLEAVVEFETPEESELLKALINGSYVSTPLDDEHKQLQLLQKNIAIAKQRILDKDKVISEQFKNQHIDSRRELEALKQTKQKIGYYNSAVVGRATGQSLNRNL